MDEIAKDVKRLGNGSPGGKGKANGPVFDWDKFQKLLKVNLPDNREELSKILRVVEENKTSLEQDMQVYTGKFSAISSSLKFGLLNLFGFRRNLGIFVKLI